MIVAKELLADRGSIFVQISEENLHNVRAVADEVFGRQNFVSQISFVRGGGQTTKALAAVGDFLLWYGRDLDKMKFRDVLVNDGGWAARSEDQWIEEPSGHRLRASEGLRGLAFTHRTLESATGSGASNFPVDYAGRPFGPKRGWSTNPGGMKRLRAARRFLALGNTLRFVVPLADFPFSTLTNNWTDTIESGFSAEKLYVVYTAKKVIERCMLMTTDPGDLVLDPTCGSGTTSYVAEQWGRRWITIDTSRVSIAIARQRLLTAKFDFYQLRPLNSDDQARNPNGTWLGLECGSSLPLSAEPQTGLPGREQARENQSGSELPHSKMGTFKCKTVPHVTLKSIAQNTNLDPIFAKHEPILDGRLAACNVALARVPGAIRNKLRIKLLEKQKAQGRKAITDADRRRWELPASDGKWEHWQVPFDTDLDYPKDLADAITEYRKAWRAKMDEVNACIAANAEQEELVDQPEIGRGVLRVSGPFTVEAVQPPEMTLGDVDLVDTGEGKFGGEPEELDATFAVREVESRTDLEAKNVEAYLEQMLRLLRMDGVQFPDNKHMRFRRLEALKTSEPGLQAEGRWVPEEKRQTEEKRQQAAALQTALQTDPEGKATVCVAFGPQYGPVTAKMVEDVIRSANRLGYDDLVIAGFSFDGPAQTTIEEAKRPKLRIHAAHIRPDVNPSMNGLLKEQPGSQLFTVFGQPRTRVDGPNREGQYAVTMEGVDIYNPVDNSITPTRADKVAAWFLDGDYDGRTFCITQAFFPDRSAWGKLSKALSDVVDPERFEALSGTKSLPFPAGKHKCVAVKVIDPRGNEVMQVHKL